MRCKNCGWVNENGILRCVKCNAPLQDSMIDGEKPVLNEDQENLKSTLREPGAQPGGPHGATPAAPSGAQPHPPRAEHSDRDTCSRCGYPLGAGANVCPVCHTPIENTPRVHTPSAPHPAPHAGMVGTINPYVAPTDSSFCTLRRLSWQNEPISYEPMSYSGESIVLNRANTDANNNSITSKEQAVLTHENGEWFIDNRSELQTTLFRVNRKLKLEDGDVVVLGNRMFEFRKG